MLKWKAKNNLCGKSYQRAQTHFLYTDGPKERTKYLSILGVLDSRQWKLLVAVKQSEEKAATNDLLSSGRWRTSTLTHKTTSAGRLARWDSLRAKWV